MLTTDVGEIAFALIFELELDSLLLHIIPYMLARVLTIESQKIEDHDRDHFFGDR